MKRYKHILLLACLLPGVPAMADQADLVTELKEIPPEASMLKRGVPVPLGDETQAQVVEVMKTLLQTCRVDSKTSPAAFHRLNKGVPFDWERVMDPLRNVSFIHVSLGKLDKLRAGNKTVYAQELLLETPAGNWPRKYMVAYDGRTSIQFGKCSGLVVVDLICMPELLPHLPKEYGRACSVLPPKSSEAVK